MENAKRTISDRVYEGLRASIMSLKMKPGDEINIKTISENLGVSRSPVRDAMLKLEKEGLVDLMPQKGTFVSRIDLARMHEERFLRESLEEKTIELFIDRHSPSDMARLKEILNLQKESLRIKNFTEFLDQDDEFHRIFYHAADKKMCWEIVQSMSGHYRRVRLLVLRITEVPENNYAQHERIFASIAKGDKDEARTLIQNHLSRLLIEEKELLKEFPDYFKTQETNDFF
jgi:GntR family transcriptional regulator, rspAB operon transcriptional repressor